MKKKSIFGFLVFSISMVLGLLFAGPTPPSAIEVFPGSSIQTAINGAPPGAVIHVNGPGTYNESLVITKSITLIGNPGDANPGPGLNAPILDGTGFIGKWAIQIGFGVTNVVIEGFEIRNYGPNGNTDADGVVAWNAGTSNVIIQDNYFHNLGYAAVLTGNGWGGSQGLHDNWQIKNNIVDTCGAYAFDIENAKNSEVSYNTISKIPWYVINIIALATEPGADIVSENNQVHHNVITDCADRIINLYAWTSGGTKATVKNINVFENTVTGIFNLLIAWKAGTGTTIENLSIENNNFSVVNPKSQNYAIDLADVGGASGFNNNFITISKGLSLAPWFHAINIGGPGTGAWTLLNNQIEGNNFSADSCGFRLRGTLSSTAVLGIEKNTITGFGNGVRAKDLASGIDVNINWNKISGNSQFGISNETTSANIDARYNWWGDNDGPSLSGPPFPFGDKVSANVDYVPWLTTPVIAPSQSVGSATGTGPVNFATTAGVIANLTAVSETSLPTTGKPAGAAFPHGLFSFLVGGITPGTSVTITITYPSAIPENIQYWKCQNDIWINCTTLLGDNDGDNILTLTLTDGGLGDADLLANGVIVDPGGVAVFKMPSFTIEEAKIDFKKKPDDDKAFVKGKFVVGGNVSVADQVIVTIGPYSETITSMEEKGKGKNWEYKRPKGETGIKNIKIEWKDGEAKFEIHIDKLAELDWVNPVPITLQIGLYQGHEKIDMKVHKDKWDYHDKK